MVAGVPELQTEGRYAIEFARWVVEDTTSCTARDPFCERRTLPGR